jgi:tetratricopeptide (TPR) repeat protein
MSRRIQSKSNYQLFLLVIISGLFLYISTTKHGFVYHDNSDIINNPTITRPQSISGIFLSNFPEEAPERSAYAPFTTLFYMAEYKIFGKAPESYHIINITIYMICLAIVSLLFIRIFKTDAESALIVTLLFVIHPLHSENAAWISGIPPVLGSVFFFAAMILSIHFRPSMIPGNSGTGKKAPVSPGYYKWIFIGKKNPFPWPLILVPLFYITGILFFQQIIILPLIIILYDFTIDRNEYSQKKNLNMRFIQTYLPMIIIIIFYILFRILFISSGSNTAEISAGMKIYNVLSVFTEYIILCIFPFKAGLLHTQESMPGLELIIPLILFIIAAAIYSFKKSRAILFGIGFLVTTALCCAFSAAGKPVSDNFAFLSTAGSCILIASLIPLIKTPDRGFFDTGKNIALFLVILILFGIFGNLTKNLNKRWASDLDLWKAEHKKNPDSGEAANNLASNYYASGDIEKATRLFKKAIKVEKNYSPAYHNLARIQIDSGNAEEAKIILMEAVKNGDKRDDENFANIGLMMMEIGRKDLAALCFRRALEANPNNVTSLTEVGGEAFEKRMYDISIEYFSKALKNADHSRTAFLRCNRGTAYLRKNMIKEATIDLEKAMTIDPEFAQPYLLLADLSVKQKFKEKAISILEDALKKVPMPPFEIYKMLHVLYKNFNNHQAAFKILHIYQKKNPRDIRIQMVVGDYCFEWFQKNPKDTSKLNTAATCYKNAHKIDPKNTNALIQYGKTALLSRNPEAAEKIWLQALKTDPENKETKLLLEKLQK